MTLKLIVKNELVFYYGMRKLLQHFIRCLLASSDKILSWVGTNLLKTKRNQRITMFINVVDIDLKKKSLDKQSNVTVKLPMLQSNLMLRILAFSLNFYLYFKVKFSCEEL